jgi:dTDP-glucose 4,6-dehydratase
MKVIVTGHRGTLGKPLVEQLRANGHAVYGVDKDHGHEEWARRADVGEIRQLDSALRFFEADHDTVVYHLAAEFGRHNGEDFYESLWKSNAIGTKNVLTCQRAMRFRLVFASSSEIYGEGPFDRELMDEGMPLRCVPQHHNDYAISKWVNERQILNARRAWGTQTMVLRFFNAYGPGEFYHPYRSVIALFIYRALMGLPYTVFRGYHRVFQYADDFISTLARACDRFADGETVNIGGEEFREVQDAHRIISKQLKLDPYRAAVSWADKDGHNTVDKRPDITKARALLGHDPKTTLEDGIQQTIAWMRDTYK